MILVNKKRKINALNPKFKQYANLGFFNLFAVKFVLRIAILKFKSLGHWLDKCYRFELCLARWSFQLEETVRERVSDSYLNPFISDEPF